MMQSLLSRDAAMIGNSGDDEELYDTTPPQRRSRTYSARDSNFASPEGDQLSLRLESGISVRSRARSPTRDPAAQTRGQHGNVEAITAVPPTSAPAITPEPAPSTGPVAGTSIVPVPDPTNAPPSTAEPTAAAAATPTPEGALDTTAASATGKTAATTTDDDYVSPNSLGIRRPYVVINVKSMAHIKNSILHEWIRNKYSVEPAYSQSGHLTSFKGKMAECTNRLTNKARTTPRCFTQEIPRTAGPPNLKGKAQERFKWSWLEHDTNIPCPNVIFEDHQCLKVVNHTTLWLINPKPDDWDRQEQCDIENHEAETQGANPFGSDAAYDTVQHRPDPRSSPIETQEQGWNDPPATPSRRHRLVRTLSMRSIGTRVSRLGHRGADLARSFSNMSLSGRTSPSTERPSLFPRAPVPPSPTRPSAPHDPSRPTSYHDLRNPARSSASAYSDASQRAPSHTSRSTFSDIYRSLANQRLAPPSYFNADNQSRSENSRGHSRTGSGTTIVPTLPDVIEEGDGLQSFNAWMRDVEPRMTRPLTRHREYPPPSGVHQPGSSGHDDSAHGRRDQSQRASYPAATRSQPPSSQASSHTGRQ